MFKNISKGTDAITIVNLAVDIFQCVKCRVSSLIAYITQISAINRQRRLFGDIHGLGLYRSFYELCYPEG